MTSVDVRANSAVAAHHMHKLINIQGTYNICVNSKCYCVNISKKCKKSIKLMLVTVMFSFFWADWLSLFSVFIPVVFWQGVKKSGINLIEMNLSVYCDNKYNHHHSIPLCQTTSQGSLKRPLRTALLWQEQILCVCFGTWTWIKLVMIVFDSYPEYLWWPEPSSTWQKTWYWSLNDLAPIA